MIFSILVPPIKAELGLSDLELGLVGGVAFALFYSTLGLPIAKLADRRSRVNIIAVCLAVWSAMTAASALVTGFWQLLAVRIGVACGEAGGTPPAHSLIGDLYEVRRRTTAIAVYQIGSPVGSAFGLFFGGWAAETYGWRAAFAMVGVPGLLLAPAGARDVARAASRHVRDHSRSGRSVDRDGGRAAALEPPELPAPGRRHEPERHCVVRASAVEPRLPGALHGLGLATIGLVLGLFGLVGSVSGTALGGYASDRWRSAIRSGGCGRRAWAS